MPEKPLPIVRPPRLYLVFSVVPYSFPVFRLAWLEAGFLTSDEPESAGSSTIEDCLGNWTLEGTDSLEFASKAETRCAEVTILCLLDLNYRGGFALLLPLA